MSPSPKPLPDLGLFAAAMRDAKPLRKAKAPPPAPATPERKTERPPLPAVPVAPPAPPNPGLDRRTAARLRKGTMHIDRRLDLHGMTEADAHATLDRFVRRAAHEGARVLLVITGKGTREGGGVLRRNLPRWLASGEAARLVLRIEPAQPRHGGGGAYYVLLRRQRP